MKRLAICAFALAVLSACGASDESSQSTWSGLSDRTPSSEAYPQHPDDDLTPGQVCSSDDADQRRYPERIAYCTRSVSTSTKRGIISTYDSELGFHVGSMDRGDFKIDHFVPLCMGGANATTNLWPQHKTVYVKTDPIEQKLCELMAQGKIRQAEAIQQIKHVKFNLDEAQAMVRRLDEELN